MRKAILTCVAVIASMFAVASIATASKPDKPASAKDVAAQQCAALKQADKAAFKSLYGKGAMANCIKGQTKGAKGDLDNAAKECKAEQVSDPIAFEQKYGNPDPYVDDSNAYGKCVSSKVGTKSTEGAIEFINAAKACKAERSLDPDAFVQTYGTGKSKGKNALGKCVSAALKA